LRLKATPNNGYATAESLVVPGVLANLFEAVAGAIYKDSGFSRIAVLGSFNPFLRHAYGN
jgi:dsRNA-specific ribonuclease